MNLFGMGAGEIMVILIVALLIFGPGKLPEIMGQVGRTVREFKKATRDLTGEFQDSIHDVQATMGEMKTTVNEMKRETTEIAASIPATIESSVQLDGVTTSGARPAGTASATEATEAATPRRAELASAAPGSSASTLPSRTPIVEPNGAGAAVATKDDPFADLAELDDALAPTDTTTSQG